MMHAKQKHYLTVKKIDAEIKKNTLVTFIGLRPFSRGVGCGDILDTGQLSAVLVCRMQLPLDLMRRHFVCPVCR